MDGKLNVHITLETISKEVVVVYFKLYLQCFSRFRKTTIHIRMAGL